MAYRKSGLYCEGRISSGAEIVIDTTNAWQHLVDMSASVCKGLSFEAGIEADITVFADAGGGQVTVTAIAHGMIEDEYVSITGTTNYNDLYQITNVTTDTVEITETFAGDDATGKLRHGAHLIVEAGQGGAYYYPWSMSAQASSPNTTFEVAIVKNGVVGAITRRKFSTSTDVGSLSGVALFEAKEGDHLDVAVRNITSAGNLTIHEATFCIFKVS